MTKIPTQGDGNGLAWGPDSRTVFYSGGPGMANVWSVSTDGTTPPRRITKEADAAQDLRQVTPRGEVIYRIQNQPEILSVMSRTGETRRIHVPPALTGFPRLSPDGKWLAYSTADGVVLQRGDEEDGQSVRIGRGADPFWSPDGSRVYFLETHEAETVTVSVVRLSGSLKVQPSKPEKLFPCERCEDVEALRSGGFVVLRTVSKPRPPASINVVLNWTPELDKR